MTTESVGATPLRFPPRITGLLAFAIAGTLLMSMGFLMQWASSTLLLLLPAIALMSIGNALNTPSLSSLISRAAGGDQQGGVLGVSQALGAMARVAGPLLGTWQLGFDIRTPYATGGAFMLAACAFAALAVRQPAGE